MKKIKFSLWTLMLLFACSTGESEQTEQTSQNTEKEKAEEKTYEFQEEQDVEEGIKWLLPHSYQVTMDESFEMVSRYETDSPEEEMFFWHEPSVDDFSFSLETTSEILEEAVPTIRIYPVNKNRYVYTNHHFTFGEELTESETEDLKETVKQDASEKSEEYIEEMKERTLDMVEGDSTVSTNEDYELEPFTYLIESETDNGVMHYELLGESEEDYLRAAMTIPAERKEEMFEDMLASLRTITYETKEFEDQAIVDEPTQLSYEPAENLKGDYPRTGYSFEIPEAATFRHSFPMYHTYRYTFNTSYEENIEREHFTLRSSEFIVRSAIEENARTREEEIRTRSLDDFVAFQYDSARSITYLHEEEDFDTGVFTTAVRVDFDGYEEYWFLREENGDVYEITFDLAFDAPRYEKLLESYLNAVRTFEITDVEE